MTTANSPHSGTTSHHHLSENSNSNTNSSSSSSGRSLPMSTNHTASTPAPIMFKTTNSPPHMANFTDNATNAVTTTATNGADKSIINQTSTTINGKHQQPMNPTALNSSKLALSFIATSPVALEASTASIIATSSVPNESSIITVQNVGNRGRKRSSTAISEDLVPMSIEDEIAIKRMKNTEAARRSRLRKAQRMESLEQEIAELKSENSRLQTRVAVLESEKSSLREKSLEKDARVRQLEQQLSEAYERLVKRDPSSTVVGGGGGGGGSHDNINDSSNNHKDREERILDDCEKYQTVAIGKAPFNSESSPPLVID
ncbi:12196_t:CDS:2 [Ambispora gerdemannii]|uniref:12196_t:CDS:1 n=1 Tax=Ambispora gerdemannii TaxID=144530 RepID=A0A9N8ZQU2_9GLOM|nr:12196_t:CDS:2 [Ambispora gerdemannii]